MKVRILATLLALTMFGANSYNGASAWSGGTARNTSTGAAKEGFAVALSPYSSTVAFGQGILVTVEIRNVSGTMQHANPGSRNGGYDFSIIDQRTGKEVPRNEGSIFGLDSVGGSFLGGPVPANYSLFLDFQLDSLYNFTAPGTYSVQVRAAHIIVNGHGVTLPPSNVITVTLR